MAENMCTHRGKYLVVNDEKIKEPLIFTHEIDLKFKYPIDEIRGSCIDFWIILK